MPLTRRDILFGGCAAICVPYLARAAEFSLPLAPFEYILERGGWSPTADDNVQGETLSVAFVRELMLAFRDNPQARSAQLGLGLLALTLGIAQWGIDAPSGLPPDPAQSDWQPQTSANTGKHVMSYGVGGVGIAHIDNDELIAFMAFISGSHLLPDEHRAGFDRLTDPALYAGADAGVYGQLRAAGICAPRPIPVDLEGAAFKHFDNSHNVGYCEKYRNPSLTSLDWQTFRTWVRVALRTKVGQRWLFSSWLQTYWDKSLAAVPPGEGAAEELLINARIRNSLPACADRAVLAPASSAERVRRELDEYAKCAPSAYERRVALMLRPVVLYRHFTGAPPLEAI